VTMAIPVAKRPSALRKGRVSVAGWVIWNRYGKKAVLSRLADSASR
jgi:hypothetical protein